MFSPLSNNWALVFISGVLSAGYKILLDLMISSGDEK